MKLKLPERRRFIRVEIPLKVIVNTDGRKEEVVTKNVSPVGLRFTVDKQFEKDEDLKMSLYLPTSEEPIGLVGKVIWQTKTSLEDNAPYDVGIEITQIKDENKNVFLKYLCDLLYSSTYKERT
ncbi:MAG: hypothetical protein GF409_01780 [Candidatus Omnitrophica bacterium]|nr:hypothetical protein [Candidatus Omnitrophota bacterium]